MHNYNIIIYNKDEMYYTEGELTSLEVIPTIIDNPYGGVISQRPYIKTYTTCEDEPKEYIKLDDTMMKRILKYNKEVEIEKLNEEIKIKEKEIKELDNKLQDKEKRWEKVKKYIANIYDIDIKEDEGYWEE